MATLCSQLIGFAAWSPVACCFGTARVVRTTRGGPPPAAVAAAAALPWLSPQPWVQGGAEPPEERRRAGNPSALEQLLWRGRLPRRSLARKTERSRWMCWTLCWKGCRTPRRQSSGGPLCHQPPLAQAGRAAPEAWAAVAPIRRGAHQRCRARSWASGGTRDLAPPSLAGEKARQRFRVRAESASAEAPRRGASAPTALSTPGRSWA